ncbi:MAG: hypothetical protein QM708_12035 [Propioniciclava sp.]|uniref:hypothetical protein n=1 Tax=Propioniciclava sp. TaxID=2038686 RepID=UPI0039E59563
MPEKSWGNSVGSGSGATLSLIYDRIADDGVNAWLVNPRIQFSSKPGWNDATNWIDTGGQLVTAGRVHTGSPLNGGTRTWNVSAKNVAMTYAGVQVLTWTATVYGVSFFNGDQATTTYTFEIQIPRRPYSKPLPANGFTVTINADLNRAECVWQGNYTGADGAHPWVNQFVEASTDNWATVVSSAALLWPATTYNWAHLAGNSRYHFRHSATNAAGRSEYRTSGPFFTPPAKPGKPVAAKRQDGAIVITAENRAPWANQFAIRDSSDGQTWTVITDAATSLPYVHQGPSSAVTHRYQVAARTPNGHWSPWSDASNTVALLAAPARPVWRPANSAFDASLPIAVAWDHTPVDTTAQTAYEIRWQSGGSWVTSGKIVTTSSSHTFAAGTFAQGVVIGRQVRTWGQHADPSAWSATATFATSARPLAGIVSPTPGSVIPGRRLRVAWAFFDPAGDQQSSWEVRLCRGQDAAPIGVWAGVGAARDFTVPYDLEDATSYTVDVRVRDGVGLWSDRVSSQIEVVYAPPRPPVVHYEWDVARAAVVLEISNAGQVGSSSITSDDDWGFYFLDSADVSPAETTGFYYVSDDGAYTVSPAENAGLFWVEGNQADAPPVDFHNIYRDGQLVATGIGVNTTWVDPLPNIAGATYRVEAVSALPSQSDTAIEVQPDTAVLRRVWLNTGPGWEVVASCWGNLRRTQTRGRIRSLDRYSGRELPVETIGEGRINELSIQGTLITADDSPADFWAVAEDDHGNTCYRDRYGSWFVTIEPVPVSQTGSATAEVAVTLTETGYRPEVL